MDMLWRIADRVVNRPLLILPQKAAIIATVLGNRIGLGDMTEAASTAPTPDASRFVGDFVMDETGRRGQPFKRTPDGIAIITVTGSLVNRGAWVGASSGLTSYEGIKHQVQQAVADRATRAILLDIESPGGEAVGAFETADAVRKANAVKPVTAVVNGMAASAAYAIASGAGRIVMTPTGIAGSIGVVLLHADFSRSLDKRGITPTLIFAGAHKVDGNPYEPLSAEVTADLQAEVNRYYDLFVETVAAGRKSLSAENIRKTEARVFIGDMAVTVGLADTVGTFESALEDVGKSIKLSTSNMKGYVMQNNDQPGITAEAHAAAVANAKTEGHAAGVKDGANAANNRMATILGSDKIKGKEATAMDLALKSPDMSAENVVAFVEKLPAATPGASADTIEQRMQGQGQDLAMGAPIQPAGGAAASATGWGKAVAKTNQSRGFAN